MTHPGGVSAVIPTYDRARYVVEAVESALAQTAPALEIIVVDDGSTDGTPQALARFGDRIRLVRQENRGESAARNRGISVARGEWVAFLDSDDMWEPRALERLARTAERHPEAGLVAMGARTIAADGTRTERVFLKKSPGVFFSAESLLRGDAGSVHTPMVRRALLLKTGGFDESLRSAQDCDLWLRLSFETRMVAVPEPLLLRREHAGNVSANVALNASMWLRVLEKLAREHPDFPRRHAGAYRRALGKERLRYGRELLARSAAEPTSLPAARSALRASITVYPFFLRAYLYLAWSLVFPSSYGTWRAMERKNR